MNRPALTNYVIGNGASVAVIVGATAFLMYRWCTQAEHGESISWLLPAVALLASSASFKARVRLANFNAWNRSWQAMSGATPQRAAGSNGARLSSVLAVVAWTGLLCWLIPHQADKTNEAGFLATLWLLLTLCGVVLAMSRALRWVLRPARPAIPRRKTGAREGEQLVEVCLPVPSGSPSLARIRAGLPDYCLKLLARSGSAAAGSGNAPTDSVQWN
jgi:hypothetical protein